MSQIVIQHIDIDVFFNESQEWKIYISLMRTCTRANAQIVCWQWYTSIRTANAKEIHVIDIPHQDYFYHPSDLPKNIQAKQLTEWEKAKPKHEEIMRRIKERDGSLQLVNAIPHIGDVSPLWASAAFAEEVEDGNPTK